MKKWLGLLVALVLVGLLAWQGYRRAQTAKAGSQKGGARAGGAVAVEVASAARTLIRDVRTFTGTLRAQAQFTVAPKVAGPLDAITVNIGDTVKRGQLIATLESEEYVQRVEQARAELLVSKANVEQCLSSLEVARREHERAQALRQKQVSSESELDAAASQFKISEANHRVALAQVAQREAALRAAEVQLSYTKVGAVWDGGSDTRVVAERFVDAGTMLRANDPIVSILDIGVLTGLIYVIERDYNKVKPGQPTVIGTDAYPGREFAGTVVRIAPLLRETSRQARVEVDIANPEFLLKPGMFVRVQIELDRHADASAIPFAALTRRNGNDGAFVVDPGTKTATFVPLELGIVNASLAEVLKPALTGPVVTLGQHLLTDGSLVVMPGEASGRPESGPGAPAPAGVQARPAGGRP